MVWIRDVRPGMFMRREVAMNHRVVIGRIRLVHVFRWDRGRHGEPWRQGRDRQDPAYRSHRHVDYMRRDILGWQADENFRNRLRIRPAVASSCGK
jgi:hypothetical protein